MLIQVLCIVIVGIILKISVHVILQYNKAEPDIIYHTHISHKELLLAFDYHSLRHTHATLLIENGADVKDEQTRLGHTNIETTLQTYVHDTEKMVERSVDLFEQVTQA